MVTTIKAIETVYNGYRFRSRLEARWGVFLDTLGIKYEYEKEGFELDDGLRYLPDFWIPSLKCWIEIKPTAPSSLEMTKAGLLAAQTRQSVYLVYGSPYIHDHFVLGFRHRYPPSKLIEYAEAALASTDRETFEGLTSNENYYWQPWLDRAWELEWYSPPSGNPYHVEPCAISYHDKCHTLSFSRGLWRNKTCSACGHTAKTDDWIPYPECFHCDEREDYDYNRNEEEETEMLAGARLQKAFTAARQARFEFGR